jgi:hypothetical protein
MVLKALRISGAFFAVSDTVSKHRTVHTLLSRLLITCAHHVGNII